MNVSAGENVSRLYEKSIVIDELNVSNWNSDAVFHSLSRGGVTARNAATAIWESFSTTMDNIARWQHRFERLSELLIPIRMIGNIYRAKQQKKTGIIIGFQNASPIETDLNRLSLFHQPAYGSFNSRITNGTCWATAATSELTKGSVTSDWTPSAK